MDTSTVEWETMQHWKRVCVLFSTLTLCSCVHAVRCTLYIVQVHNYRISHKLYTQFYRIFAAIKVLNRTYDSNLLLFRLLVRLISFFNHFHLHLHFHFDFLFSSHLFGVAWFILPCFDNCQQLLNGVQTAQAYYRNHILLSYNENSLNAMAWKHTL